MRRDRFLFGPIDSAQYGVWLAGPGTAGAPQRDISAVQVPGRSGSLLLDGGRWMDIEVRYQAAITRGFEERFGALRAALCALQGFHRLEDTICPEQYRMAALLSPIEPQTAPFHRAGQFEIIFHCRPQRFLKSGELPVTLTASGTALRNAGFPALPLITLYGSGPGTFSIGSRTVQIKALAGSLTLDCELQDAYKGYENRNADISAPEFPVLEAGENTVSWTGGISRAEIIPRWWVL